jgi:hypothetical protein
MRPLIAVLLGVVALGGAGCSTLSSYESIGFETNPPGAEVVVQCGETRRTTVTPGHVLLPRKAPDCLATIRKEGYSEEQLWLRSSVGGSHWDDALAYTYASGGVLVTSSSGGGVDAEIAGEVMVGGLIPWIVNVVTCKFCDHGPSGLKVTLRPQLAQAAK